MQTQIWATEGGRSTLVLEVDATIREGHAFSQEATEHPVEDGADVTDHIREKADTLSLECVISNTPIMRGEDLVAAGLVAAPGKGSRVPAADQALRSLKGRTCDVVTELRKYADMVLLTCDEPRTAATGDALIFTASFRQIRRVKTATVRVRAAATHANKPANLGQQPATKADEAARAKSILFRLDETTFGGFLDRLGKGQ